MSKSFPFLLTFALLAYHHPLMATSTDKPIDTNAATLEGSGFSQFHIDLLDSFNTHQQVKIDLFVMSQCPYGVLAEENILPIIQRYPDKIDFNIYFIFSKQADGHLQSTHGVAEVEENIRQKIIFNNFRSSFYEYMSLRANHYSHPDWTEPAKAAGINIQKLVHLIENTSVDSLFEENMALCEKLMIRASPTVLINGQTYNGRLFENSHYESKNDLKESGIAQLKDTERYDACGQEGCWLDLCGHSSLRCVNKDDCCPCSKAKKEKMMDGVCCKIGTHHVTNKHCCPIGSTWDGGCCKTSIKCQKCGSGGTGAIPDPDAPDPGMCKKCENGKEADDDVEDPGVCQKCENGKEADDDKDHGVCKKCVNKEELDDDTATCYDGDECTKNDRCEKGKCTGDAVSSTENPNCK